MSFKIETEKEMDPKWFCFSKSCFWCSFNCMSPPRPKFMTVLAGTFFLLKKQRINKATTAKTQIRTPCATRKFPGTHKLNIIVVRSAPALMMERRYYKPELVNSDTCFFFFFVLPRCVFRISQLQPVSPSVPTMCFTSA